MRVRCNGSGTPDAGFSLAETLVVLAIFSLALATVGYHLPRGFAKVLPQRIAGELVLMSEAARIHALISGQTVDIHYDPEKRQFNLRDGVPKSVSVPYEISLSFTYGAVSAPNDDLARIRFFPDGGSSGAEIVMEAVGRRAEVKVDWLTGAASLR